MQAAQPFLVYRDRIGAASEIGFLGRQYIGFTRLRPVWIGRTLLPDAGSVGDQIMRLGGSGPTGPVRRLLFRHFGFLPGSLANLQSDTLARVLHAQFARGGVLALPLARALNLRMVITLHGGDISKRKNWNGTVLAHRWEALVREAACFVCVSSAVADLAAEKGIPPGKLRILPIGVEVPDRPPAVEVPDRPPATSPAAFLFVGRFVEKKGISTLCAAMRGLRAQGDATPLTCVGDGPLRPMLLDLARDLPGITLTGWLSPQAVRIQMTQAVALIVPSVVAADGDAEGLPSVVAEAMAQSCVVIGSDQGGIAEAVAHGRTGLLFPPGNAAALADAMHRVTQDRALCMALAAAGFDEAATNLNAIHQSRKLETLLLAATGIG